MKLSYVIIALVITAYPSLIFTPGFYPFGGIIGYVYFPVVWLLMSAIVYLLLSLAKMHQHIFQTRITQFILLLFFILLLIWLWFSFGIILFK